AGLAEHLMRGATPGDEEALEWLTRAAREVARRAPGVAVEMFQRAGEVAGWSHPSYSKLLAEQALCLSWSGQSRAAETICREALARGVDHPEEAMLHLCLVQSLATMGRLHDALRHATEAIGSESMCEPSRARLLAWIATCRLALVDLEGATEAAERAWRMGEAAEDCLTQCIGMVVLAWIAHQRGRLDAAMELSAKAVRLADASPAHEAHRFPVLLLRGLILIDLDRVEEARTVISQGRQIAEELGIRGTLPAYFWASARAHFAAGAWDDADAECVSALELSEETEMRQGALFAHAIRCLIALHRNDLGGAARAAAAGEREFEGHGHHLGLDWMMWAKGLLAEAEGNPDAALAILSNAWDALSSLGLVAGRPLLGPDLVRLALGAGESGRADEVVGAMERMARSSPDMASVSRAALRCRGLLDNKLAAVLEAVSSYRGSSRPLELALACEDAAEMACRQERAAEARPLLEEALQIYKRLEASRGMARVDSRLRTLGLRRGRQGRRSRPRSGWDSLTEAELKVASLVVVGLSNPQIAQRLFLSRPTVRTHVSHILAKLKVSSRVALAAEAARRRTT
ncbi:MAG: LuxR C-terminal-related transcriptional regulator, partial [Actinomycetota bacterium]